MSSLAHLPCLQAMKGMVVALDPARLLVIDRADYDNVIENGFDGQLKKKVRCIMARP